MSWILSWLANHWLIVAAVVVVIAAALQPALVWKFKAWVLLAVVLWWGWTGHAATDALQTKFDRQGQELAEQRAAASEAARKKEQAHTKALADVGTQHQKELANAQDIRDDVLAAQRGGTLQLRKHWTCPAAEAGAGPGEPDGAADLRATGSSDLVRLLAEADAQVRGLQEVTKADRAAVNP